MSDAMRRRERNITAFPLDIRRIMVFVSIHCANSHNLRTMKRHSVVTAQRTHKRSSCKVCRDIATTWNRACVTAVKWKNE